MLKNGIPKHRIQMKLPPQPLGGCVHDQWSVEYGSFSPRSNSFQFQFGGCSAQSVSHSCQTSRDSCREHISRLVSSLGSVRWSAGCRHVPIIKVCNAWWGQPEFVYNTQPILFGSCRALCYHSYRAFPSARKVDCVATRLIFSDFFYISFRYNSIAGYRDCHPCHVHPGVSLGISVLAASFAGRCGHFCFAPIRNQLLRPYCFFSFMFVWLIFF